MIEDADVTIYLGDALEELAKLPAESVHCIVTSPPFWALRDYGTGEWRGGDPECDHAKRVKASRRKRVEGGERSSNHANEGWTGGICGRCGAELTDAQIGLEATPEAWAARLVEVFRECRRVLRADGTLWLEVGDTYNANQGAGFDTNGDGGARKASAASPARARPAGLKPKDLVGAPWLLAFALRQDGWYLRAECIWHRPNPMPESATDRPTKAHSQVFLLSRSPRYFYDADAIREPINPESVARYQRGSRYDDQAQVDAVPYKATRPRGTERRKTREGVDTNGGAQASGEMGFPLDVGANARSVWKIATEPTPFEHFATMASEVARRCIAAGTSEVGCCPECGAPWQRVSERTVVNPGGRTTNGTIERTTRQRAFTARRESFRTTTGWVPQCEHGADDDLESDGWAPVPCTVLDPFMGSGTTALVARRLGRHAVGIELSPAYLEIARERLSQQSLFA